MELASKFPKNKLPKKECSFCYYIGTSIDDHRIDWYLCGESTTIVALRQRSDFIDEIIMPASITKAAASHCNSKLRYRLSHIDRLLSTYDWGRIKQLCTDLSKKTFPLN